MTDWHLYSNAAKQAVILAQKHATDSRTNLVRPVHLALGCVTVEGNVRRMLESLGRRYEIEAMLNELLMAPSSGTTPEPPSVRFSPIAESGVELAPGIAQDRSKRANGILRKAPVCIQTLDLLAGTMQKSVQISAAFADLDVPTRQFLQMADFMPIEEGTTPTSKPGPGLLGKLGLR